MDTNVKAFRLRDRGYGRDPPSGRSHVALSLRHRRVGASMAMRRGLEGTKKKPERTCPMTLLPITCLKRPFSERARSNASSEPVSAIPARPARRRCPGEGDSILGGRACPSRPPQKHPMTKRPRKTLPADCFLAVTHHHNTPDYSVKYKPPEFHPPRPPRPNHLTNHAFSTPHFANPLPRPIPPRPCRSVT